MTVQETEMLILEELYNATIEKGDQVSLSTTDIAKKRGIPENFRNLAWIKLTQSPLTEGFLGNDHLMLSMAGIEAFEHRDSPDSLVYQLQQNIIQAHTLNAHNIQQGTGNIALTLTYQEVFQKLEQEIEKSDKLKPEEKKNLLSRLWEFSKHPMVTEVLKGLIFPTGGAPGV